MKKEYLKPEILETIIVCSNLMVTSNDNEGFIPGGGDIDNEEGMAVGRTQGDWDKIWK